MIAPGRANPDASVTANFRRDPWSGGPLAEQNVHLNGHPKMPAFSSPGPFDGPTHYSYRSQHLCGDPHIRHRCYHPGSSHGCGSAVTVEGGGFRTTTSIGGNYELKLVTNEQRNLPIIITSGLSRSYRNHWPDSATGIGVGPAEGLSGLGV